MKNGFLLLIFPFLSITLINAQKWVNVDNSQFRSTTEKRITIPTKYESYELDIDHFKSILKEAPKRFESDDNGIIINWPMPDNKFQKFEVKRSDVFHPELAAKYPEIKAYTGHGLTDPTAILKISVSHKGIEGMLLSHLHETVYLDRYLPKSESQYILYKKSDYNRELKPDEGQCTVEVPQDGYKETDNIERFGDCQLRKYRLALACTGEYATFHGGNIPDVLAEYNASMVRVNGIYERDIAITMELIPNTDQLIFLNGGTDPYTNDSGSAMLTQNQSTIDQIIGFDNYDIGHVYSTGGGGIASLRSPCTSRKARGVTGLNNPTGDFFWVDYVSHEMGHQFGGTHTFNNLCDGARTGSTAVEPGSGSTIMAYAGICGPNVQNRSDDYFHSVSLSQFANFVIAGNGNCAELITIENNAPEIESITQSGMTLPSQTPFFLTATASDTDSDLLTYCWEQIDNEIADMPPEASATGGPSFRTYDPELNPTRYFPRLLSVLFGINGTTWEVLPNSNREMNFNLTVRDNNPVGGCTTDEEVSITFTSEAGPFMITSQNTSTTWNVGDTETITWDVANTDVAPVSCENVDIIFSSDKAENFDIILAENVPNDGEHEISVPFEITNQGRIMLKCSSSTFFDINNVDIRILAPFSAEIDPAEVSICLDEPAIFNIDYVVFGSDPYPVDFSINGLPQGATFNFSPETPTTDTEVVLTIENLTNDITSIFDLEIVVEGETLTKTLLARINIFPNQNSPVAYMSPDDGQSGISNAPTLSWNALEGISEYEVEVSDSPKFENIIFGASSNMNLLNISGLASMTVYYWRVRGLSPCLDPEWSTYRSFQTGARVCSTETLTANIPIAINTSGEIESDIEVSSASSFAGLELSMNILHTWVGDLSAKLRAPDGTEVTVFEQPGKPATDFGCGEDNMNVTFATNAVNTAEDFENTCETTGIAIEGAFQPVASFSAVENIQTGGTWTLIISDAENGDGGELVDWSITTCGPGPIPSGVILTNNVLQLDNTTEGIISSQLLEIETAEPMNTRYILRSTPMSGLVKKWNETSTEFEELEIGDMFSQQEIDLELVKYELTDISAQNDSFLFDTEDEQSRYTSNNTFLITSSITSLSISASITNQITCFGETNGRIEVTGIGGVPDYTYSINEGPFETQSVFDNLGAGEYTIKVRDDIGNEVTSNVLTIEEPAQLTFVFFPGDNSITIGADGGTGTYMYSLDGINYSTESTLEISDGETYRIHVQDENGCIAQSNSESTFYQISSVNYFVFNVDCKGNDSGSITILGVSGGEAPYMFQLNGGALTSQNTFGPLSPGLYEIMVTDNSGNTFNEMNIEVTEAEVALEISSNVVENTITLNAIGGDPSYQYSIDCINFVENNVFTDLDDGVYQGCIIDGNGCRVTEESIIVNTSSYSPRLEQINLFPNPTNANFILGSDANIDLEYQIIDITGIVLSQNSTPTNRIIDIEELPVGLYMIKVNHEDSFRVFKLSKI